MEINGRQANASPLAGSIAAILSLSTRRSTSVAPSRSRAVPGPHASGVAKGKIEFARELLTEADPFVERLESASKGIRAKTVAGRVRHLASVARRIFEAIEKDPLRIDRVRRFLTYYLPRAAEMAEAYQSLEASPRVEAGRLTATGEIIDRLDAAFTEYAANLHLAELDKLDIELKLLKRSLDEDLASPSVLDGAPRKRA
ncbi:MAG TPA: 5-bromo-4-chloroindolyl phosphate hydrolysis family protein [Sphingomicrobium sp.]|nr:5-bromo-4-chloroindolyl phosphate hydrolysis family protein [Sphingomicrobium sp.]